MQITQTTHERLAEMLDALKLTAIRDQLDRLLGEAARQELTLADALAMLCERELGRRHERRIEMGLSIAKFPAVRELSTFDYKAQPSLDSKQIKDLAAGRWIGLGETVLLLGPTEPAS
jgi:DNA replication protein DnaC